MLIEALKHFISPLLKSERPTKEDLNDLNNIHLAPEAQAVIDALEKFVAAVIRPQLVGNDITNICGASSDATSMADTDLLDKNTSTSISTNETSPEKSALLKLALEEARERVFNKMPIRVLAFKKDGSGIELVERNILLQRILTTMEAEFDEQKINSKIQDENEAKKVITEFVSQHTQYATLSHTWLHDSPGEVTYADWKRGEFELSSTGYHKLASFCKLAATNHNVTLGWMDTVCINKDSSSELDESIRSMYKWYSNATICITYLAQTSARSDMRNDPWFTRGWTLQELLAPSTIKFYSASWMALGPSLNDKNVATIQQEITAATTITGSELLDFLPTVSRKFIRYIPISRRMRWAANRRVTREEDIAYSLMGIFGVSISIAYGEGSERAFMRLVKEILSSFDGDVLDVINWGSGPSFLPSTNAHPSTLIPSSPRQYLWHKDYFLWPDLISPITLTHLGLHLPVLLMPTLRVDLTSLLRSFTPFTPIGNYYATAQIELRRSPPPGITRKTFNVLEKSISIQDNQNRTDNQVQVTLGVLNFTEYETEIKFPDLYRCFAVAFVSSDTLPLDRDTRLLTKSPVVFDLKWLENSNDRKVPKIELIKHGIELRTMYL